MAIFHFGAIFITEARELCAPLIRRLHLVSFVISTNGICNKMYIIALNQMFAYVGFCILTQELSLIFQQQQEAETKFYKNVIQYSRGATLKISMF